MMKKIDWKSIPRSRFASTTSTDLARELGTTRQNVDAARKRLGMPPSPAGHGGDRRSGRASFNIDATPEQIQAWRAKAEKAGLSPAEWASRKLDR